MPERHPADEDRRRSARFSVGGSAKINLLPSHGIFIPGTIRDLSLHGCCVDTTLTINCGVRAEIVVRVNAASFRAVGEVRAIRGRSGAGMEFVRLSAGGKHLLADMMAQLARVQAAMNRLRAARREMDAEFLRKQLEEGELQAALLTLGTRFPFVDASSELDEAESAGEDLKAKEQPLVIPVNLFG